MTVARIESLAHGPHGIARVDGKVHFVRQAVPGDEVEIEIDEDHRAYAYAHVTRVLANNSVLRQCTVAGSRVVARLPSDRTRSQPPVSLVPTRKVVPKSESPPESVPLANGV